MSQTGGQTGGLTATQAQTDGELSNWVPCAHNTFSTHEPGTHLPVVGSQSLPVAHSTAAHRFGPQSLTPSCLKNWAEVPDWAGNLMSAYGVVSACVVPQPAPGDINWVMAIRLGPARSTARKLASYPPVGFVPAA